ncbi:TIGR03915 family putative DNA repair protein [Geotalea sp. SG265]|uniref:TIGR03915 family putative DNA repair protein n=1 Tax=Geotalea sp. SG265 TaxID=2922867 RepID=UPI001FAF6B0F|nr:TIGR03915 family putative DNA repair protein [Geotalea sp. SG265]
MGGDYCYDGSDVGLLTLLADIIPRRVEPRSIGVEQPQQKDLFTAPVTVTTDPELAERFRVELFRRLTPLSLEQLRRAWYADHPGRELMICRFLLLVWREGGRAGTMLANPHVAPFWKLAQQVGREAHRYLGFVRFRETTSGYYYASLAPDHRVLSLIAGHFADRFRDQHWVIHDLRHGEGIVYDCTRRRWLLLPMLAEGDPELTPAEETFQRLWRKYFAVLAIGERENLSLQQGKVPLKVRPWLMEFSE